MDGFCHPYTLMGQCPSYSYVPQSDVQPYFDIATNYGYANYFFQTNEGPSFEAHQFLFTGTAAGVAPGQLYSQYFVAENPTVDIYGNVGCPYLATNNFPNRVNTAAGDIGDPRQQSQRNECYPHDTLVTNSSGDKGVTWGYYTPSMPAIWDAPAAIPEVCYGSNSGTPGTACGGAEWGNCGPLGTMAFDQAGNLYGAAQGGLPSCAGYDCGVIFKLSPQRDGKWTYSVLHKLTGADGEHPLGLVIDGKGHLFGTTQSFGKYIAGTAFEITP